MYLKFSLIKKISSIIFCLCLITSMVFPALAIADGKPLNINKLYAASKSQGNKDNQENRKREIRFKKEKNKQQKNLSNMINSRKSQEDISHKLEVEFDNNEKLINDLKDDLALELGNLKELFGVVQQAGSDAQEDYKSSFVSAQFPNRSENLREIVSSIGDTNKLVSIEEIEKIWFELQNEMTQQGKIVKFSAPVNFPKVVSSNEDGKEASYHKENHTVTRIGVFNSVIGNNVAVYNPSIGLVALDRKMNKDFIAKAQNLQNSTSGLVPFYIDPTRGSLISALVKKPSFFEKISEGKIVGTIIIVLGILALFVVLYKILILFFVERKVNQQSKRIEKPTASNPLGRLLSVFNNNLKSDPESLGLKLDEVILKETPKLNSWLMFVKIAAVVAPLLGLLGTVTGMIQTFQAITLYGAGDPQLMASGISQALVTTVLGLVVAIPIVLLHSSALGRANKIEGILQEYTSSLIARRIDDINNK